MPERTTEEIRKEIAAERLSLHEDIDALKARLRSLVPFVLAGLVGVALLAVAVFLVVRKIRKP
jgi:hypothetical protein